jgi:hypothetical protein
MLLRIVFLLWNCSLAFFPWKCTTIVIDFQTSAPSHVKEEMNNGPFKFMQDDRIELSSSQLQQQQSEEDTSDHEQSARNLSRTADNYNDQTIRTRTMGRSINTVITKRKTRKQEPSI